MTARAVAADEKAELEQQVTRCPHSSWGQKGAAADMPDTGCLGAPSPPWHLSHLQVKEMGGCSDNVPSCVRRGHSQHMLAEGPLNSNKIPNSADHLPSQEPAIGFIFQ